MGQEAERYQEDGEGSRPVRPKGRERTDPSGFHDGFGCSAVPRSASGKSPGGCRVAVALTTIAPRFQVG